MKKILLVAGHPDINTDSVGNKLIVDGIEKKLEGKVTVHKLGELYPDFKIDVEKEQQILVDHDIIIFQFPFFWYTAPALMKKWFDDVFVYGFSHGTGGDKLHGKKVILSVTTGAPAAAYTHEGVMGHTIEELLYVIDTTIKMTGMEKIGLVKTSGISYTARANGLHPTPEVEALLEKHIDGVVEILNENL